MITPEGLSTLTALAWALGLGLLAARLAGRVGVPDVAFFLLLGVLLGPSVLGLMRLGAGGPVGALVLTGGAVFMLYEGGRAVTWHVLRTVWRSVALLATVGVAVTAAVVAAAAHLAAGLPWPVALLTGAVVAATDPATIVPLFEQVRVTPRLRELLVAESACNDATGSVLTLALLSLLVGHPVGSASLLVALARLLLVGLVAGLAVGVVVEVLVAEGGRLGQLWHAHEEEAVASLVAMATAYVLAASLGGSGFLAVFVAGVVRGNGLGARRPARRGAVDGHSAFMKGAGTVLRILLFTLLGAAVDLRLVATFLLPGLLLTAVLLFLARPLTVLVSLTPDRHAGWRWSELLFAAWVRETGVVPAALAGILLALDAPDAKVLAALVFLAVLISILVQTTTTGYWARRTGVTALPSPSG